MNKKILLFIVLFLFSIGIFFVSGKLTGNSIKEYQEVVIDMKDYTYTPLIMTVKKDIPVRIRITDNVQGCFRNIIFTQVNINKYFANSKDYVDIIFPQGKYTFRCSMNMGRGTIISE